MNVGIVASSVVIPSAVDVLLEPFNDFTTNSWSLNGTPTITTGRTGNGARTVGATDRCDYTIPSASRTTTVTLGFAWRTNTTSATARQVASLATGGNANEAIRISYNGTTAQSFTIFRLGTGTVVGTTVTGLVPVNTWAYLELQTVLDDTAGTVVFRVNGVERLNVGGLDTRPGTDPAVDTIRLLTAVSGLTNLYDDLYLTEGAGASFKGDTTIP